MAGKSAMPLLLAAGAVALMMGGKKKKTAATKEVYVPPKDEPTVYIPETPPAKQKPIAGKKKPAGNPPHPGNEWDPIYWGEEPSPPGSVNAALENIREHFQKLGYPVDIGPWPMNVLGPKGTGEYTNKPGSSPAMGKVGGGDDVPNPTVTKFQKEYNGVSRMNKLDKVFPNVNMGGVYADGKVGPHTLNALRLAFTKSAKWQEFVHQAKNKGWV